MTVVIRTSRSADQSAMSLCHRRLTATNAAAAKNANDNDIRHICDSRRAAWRWRIVPSRMGITSSMLALTIGYVTKSAKLSRATRRGERRSTMTSVNLREARVWSSDRNHKNVLGNAAVSVIHRLASDISAPKCSTWHRRANACAPSIHKANASTEKAVNHIFRSPPPPPDPQPPPPYTDTPPVVEVVWVAASEPDQSPPTIASR